MNRTDRMLAIVLQLQAHGWQRAEDLAAYFEISRRTVYRDMTALMESGVPVISEPGRGFRLMDGYFLPPLHFTEDEAMLLLLGAANVASSFDAPYQRTVAAASAKIETALPERLHGRVRDLLAYFHFVGGAPTAGGADPALLGGLRRAILERRRVRFVYHSRVGPHSDADITRRDADPYALVNIESHWYLSAYCHLRRDVRFFRLERIESFQVLGQTFIRPETINDSGHSPSTYPLVVRVCFKPEVARWVREAPSYYQVAAEDTAEGLLVTLRVREEQDVLQWLLGWGAKVQVLEPASLRDRIREEAFAILNQEVPEIY